MVKIKGVKVNNKNKENCKKILSHFGDKSQLLKTVEEATELSLSVQHFIAKKALYSDVVTEIADVIIMCEQMKTVFGAGLIEFEVDRKISRTIKLIEGLNE